MEARAQDHKAKIRLRAGFSISHLRAASRFAIVAAEIEDQHREEKLSYDGFFCEIQDHVVACVLMSVAALEANINEVLADDDWFPEAVHHVREVIADLLDDEPILKKYQSVLRLKGTEPLVEGADPFQSAKALVDLRNALVHFRPEWDDEQVKHKTVGDKIRYKFEPSPFFSSEYPLYPKRCMSGGCANWAVRTAILFMERFHDNSEIKSKFGADYCVKLLQKHS